MSIKTDKINDNDIDRAERLVMAREEGDPQLFDDTIDDLISDDDGEAVTLSRERLEMVLHLLASRAAAA